jgi:uncharacterized protein YyaL (SSP411 family)
MITAFAKGYRVTNDSRYLDAAKELIKIKLQKLMDILKTIPTL